MAVHLWEIRSPDGGSNGLEFSRSRIDVAERVIVHAAPGRMNVEVFDESSRLVAKGSKLKSSEHSPMALLTIEGESIRREQIWPGEEHLGLPVILPGGEVGILTAWWNADDYSAWRWTIELSNQRR
ncbi:MAG: hypothetical protein ACRDH5_16815 [bacterium]